MVKEKAARVVKSGIFKKVFLVLGIIFIILTYFISIKPDAFLKYSYAGVFVFNLISSGLLLLPALTGKLNIFLLVFVSALGNLCNTSINYLVGNTSQNLFSNHPIIVTLKKWMERFGLLVVYALAIIPLPLDINGLLSGYVGIPYLRYILVNFLGKLTIFFLVVFGIVTIAKSLH
jgi:membrane protein YqaA with SNARE-associated domain